MQPGEERDFVVQVFLLTSTGSSSSPELYLGKQDPCWVYMLQFFGICLIGNAWCRISSRVFWPWFDLFIKHVKLLQQFTKSTWFDTADYGVSHCDSVSSTGQRGLGWGKPPFTIENQGLWSWLLSQNYNFFLFVFWYAYSISPTKLVDSF